MLSPMIAMSCQWLYSNCLNVAMAVAFMQRAYSPCLYDCSLHPQIIQHHSKYMLLVFLSLFCFKTDSSTYSDPLIIRACWALGVFRELDNQSPFIYIQSLLNYSNRTHTYINTLIG